MACYWLHQHETKISIPSIEDVNTVTYYVIVVNVGDVEWCVTRRYSEFYELHNALVMDHGLTKDLLPPKKTIGNKSPTFIESRRVALEAYLKYILTYLSRTMPPVFTEFLHFHLYDTFYILQKMASRFYNSADQILSSKRAHIFNPLELYSIGECFKNPFPKVELPDKCCDLSHVLDLCSQLKQLTVEGKEDFHIKSNIKPNTLSIEFASFKAVECLTFTTFHFQSIKNLATLRDTVQKLQANFCNTESVAEILLCDVVHKDVFKQSHIWSAITVLDLTSNQLQSVDKTISLVPNVEIIIFNDNKLVELGSFTSLTKLKHFYANNNLISVCNDLHTKFGNILTLELSQNRISSAKGLSKLYSLESLNLSSNRIEEVESVTCLGDLPCLENLTLTGNPVATSIDYRIKVLEHFDERAKDLCLDNERALQSEIDKALVLRALRIAKERRSELL